MTQRTFIRLSFKRPTLNVQRPTLNVQFALSALKRWALSVGRWALLLFVRESRVLYFTWLASSQRIAARSNSVNESTPNLSLALAQYA